MQTAYLEPTNETGTALFKRRLSGEVIMLNLLRFRDTADYSANPELEPASPITGREAFERYIEATLPFLKESSGELLLLGEGGRFFIGPPEERWDAVMMVKQHSIERFFDFASNADYLAGLGHRTAAVIDSRLLPIKESAGHRLVSKRS